MHDRYDPYLHGTSSAILPFLKRTNFTLMSPIRMLQEYALAPMSGEIAGFMGGGHDHIEGYDHVCFGRLHAEKIPEAYDLDYILSLYAKKDGGFKRLPETLNQLHSTLVLKSFESINLYLIQLARDVQSGSVSASMDNILEHRNIIEAGIIAYRMLALLGNDIYPNFFIFKEFIANKYNHINATPLERKRVSDFYDATLSHLSFLSIHKRVLDSGLKLDQMTNIDLHAVLSLLSFPEPLYEQTCFFTTDKTKASGFRDDGRSGLSVGEEDRYSANHTAHELDAFFRRMFIDELYSEKDLSRLSDSFSKRAEILTSRLAIFDRLVNKIKGNDVFDKNEKDLVADAFPVVFLASPECHLVKNGYPIEYNSIQPIVVGKDITIIATDTAHHQEILRKYLQENGLSHVLTINFDQLRECKDSGKRPQVSASVSSSRFSLHAPDSSGLTNKNDNDDKSFQP